MESKITAICQECNKQFDYVLKPGFPRKYCFECSDKKKADFEDMQSPEVVKPGANAVRQLRDDPDPFRKHTAMYTSYAKDIFCAIIDKETDMPRVTSDIGKNTMNKAIELVKQAREAFS